MNPFVTKKKRSWILSILLPRFLVHASGPRRWCIIQVVFVVLFNVTSQSRTGSGCSFFLSPLFQYELGWWVGEISKTEESFLCQKNKESKQIIPIILFNEMTID